MANPTIIKKTADYS